MGKFSFNHTVTRNSAGYVVLNSFGSVSIPEEYRLASVPLIWSIGIAGSTGSTTNSGQQLWYKTNGNQSTNTSITTSLNTNQTSNLILTNATTLKFMFQTYFTVGSGAGYGQRIWYCILQLPFGGISSETIITAAKLNKVAEKLNMSETVSATAGAKITRASWQTLGDTQSITFDTTKPLLTNLNSLLELVPASWEATGQEDVGW